MLFKLKVRSTSFYLQIDKKEEEKSATFEERLISESRKVLEMK